MTSIYSRGLMNYIKEIQLCPNKGEEMARVKQEFAKIRKKFSDRKNMKSYDLRKYISKLMYTFLLGYEIDFANLNVTDLLDSKTFADKQIGYIAAQLLFSESSDFAFLITERICMDLKDDNDAIKCLAIQCVGSIGGDTTATAVVPIFNELLSDVNVNPFVAKKCLLCALRFYRKYPECFDIDEWLETISGYFGKEITIASAALALLIGFAKDEPKACSKFIPLVINFLQEVLENRSDDLKYHGLSGPWILDRCFEYLKMYPEMIEDYAIALRKLLMVIFAKPEPNKKSKYTTYGLLLDAIEMSLLLHHGNDELTREACHLISKFFMSNHPNLKLTGLMLMRTYIRNENVRQSIKKYRTDIFAMLEHPDASVVKDTLFLIYEMSTIEDGMENCSTLIGFLETCPVHLKRHVVSKATALAEKFAGKQGDVEYIKIVFDIAEYGGDYLPDDVWHRMIHYVANFKELQSIALERANEILGQQSHEAAFTISVYLVGEFLDVINDEDGTLHEDLVKKIVRRYPHLESKTTVRYVLSALAKIAAHEESSDSMLRMIIKKFLEKLSSHRDIDIQQKAVELLHILSLPDNELTFTILSTIPEFDLENIDHREEQIIEIERESKEEEDSVEESDEEEQETPLEHMRVSSDHRENLQRGLSDIDLLNMGSPQTAPKEKQNFIDDLIFDEKKHQTLEDIYSGKMLEVLQVFEQSLEAPKINDVNVFQTLWKKIDNSNSKRFELSDLNLENIQSKLLDANIQILVLNEQRMCGCSKCSQLNLNFLFTLLIKNSNTIVMDVKMPKNMEYSDIFIEYIKYLLK
eukprot:TRINITY_DN2119_c0_g1_i1.p1 TRINITY_DN2119_c0_g1~~TRINITY_DN2119_c0_g1_i1.p1  ORF type:complete len:822 (-),score=241.94 TRINITY_DN2119_c0_g1_i1:14-2443(-)